MYENFYLVEVDWFCFRKKMVDKRALFLLLLLITERMKENECTVTCLLKPMIPEDHIQSSFYNRVYVIRIPNELGCIFGQGLPISIFKNYAKKVLCSSA